MEEPNRKRQVSDFVRQFLVPKHFFGAEDANDEWQDPKLSSELFFHSESYDELKKDQCYYLFGRRGTGKTYLMRMLDYEANRGVLPGFCCSLVVKEEDAYHDLAIQLRSSPFGELPQGDLVHLIIKKWRWIITVSAMQSVYGKYRELCNDTDYAIVKKYLELENLSPDSSSEGIWEKLAFLVNESLESIDYVPVKLGRAVMNISRKLMSPEYSKAEASLQRLLRLVGKKCLVLIDSIELYDIHDKISKAVITALVDTVRQFNNDKASAIRVKAAFPSEIYPLLQSLNKEKTEGRNLFILWKFKDLFCMLAKRYFKKYSDARKKYKYKDMDDYDMACDYLYGHFPEKITTEQGLEFNSVAYIIRHTQKKPRQIIMLLNIIHTLAEENGMDPMSITPEIIKEGVHARLDILVDGSLDIYEQIYPEATRIVKRVLNGINECFDYSDLTTKIAEVSALRTAANLSREDVIRLMLESGAIGIRIKDGHMLSNGIELIPGHFEYQVKGTIVEGNSSKFVVHPMYYQETGSNTRMKVYVYPVPLEDEEQQLIEKINVTLK